MKYKHFSIEEREKIQRLLWRRKSIRAIAKALGRSHTSVSREIDRHNAKQPKRYTPRKAEERAHLRRKSRGRKLRLKNEAVRTYVREKLRENWSPEQIAGCIKVDTGETISHEAIYQYIYAQIHRNGWGLLRSGCEDLRIYLKRRRKRRMKKGMRRPHRFSASKAASIEMRPKIVERRTRIGDWEGDSIVSRRSKVALNTLVERKTGLVFITRIMDGTALSTKVAVTRRLRILPISLRHTLTVDNGSENSCTRELEEALDIDCYHAHPYASWERGTNENTNGLIRWYLPKGTDFALVSDAMINDIETALNNRPRKRLGWKTPLQALSGALRS
jgi:IS30 family transposase